MGEALLRFFEELFITSVVQEEEDKLWVCYVWPGEHWQIQAALGALYEATGQREQARSAFGEAATIIQGLAGGIGDETLRARFLAGPQIQQVLQ